MTAPATFSPGSKTPIHDVRTTTMRVMPDERGHGWKCISLEPSLVVNVVTEPYRYDDPDEYRLDPHGTLPYDWTRKDG